MKTDTLALFDLDNTLLPIDSDYEWGEFMVRIGAVDKAFYEKRNAEFFEQYQSGRIPGFCSGDPCQISTRPAQPLAPTVYG